MSHPLENHSKNPNSNFIKRVLLSISPCPTKEQLKKSKIHQTRHNAKNTNRIHSTKSFVQVIALAVNILKIKKAFSALLDNKIIEIHNIVLKKPTTKERNYL